MCGEKREIEESAYTIKNNWAKRAEQKEIKFKQTNNKLNQNTNQQQKNTNNYSICLFVYGGFRIFKILSRRCPGAFYTSGSVSVWRFSELQHTPGNHGPRDGNIL